MSITQARLKELVDYNPETGLMLRKVKKGHKELGNNTSDYLKILLDGKQYQIHKLAWLWVHGELPSIFVDHRDLNRRNNRIDNLRLCSFTENNRNRGKLSNNTSGYKGVSKNKRGRYIAQATHNGVTVYLGSFTQPDVAFEAYPTWAKAAHGEFVNLS